MNSHIILWLFCVLLCSSAFALDRNRTLAQFHHTAWTAKDGAPSQIGALAQTTDGYLWIGTARGLFRFDGIEFEPYVPPGGVSFPSHSIYAMLATLDGGLWVSFRPNGLAFIKDGRAKVFSRPDEIPKSEVFTMAQDAEGRIWAGTLTGLALFDGDRWIEIGSEWNLGPKRVWSMFTDRDGTFWAAMDDTIVYLPRGSRSFQQTGIRTSGVPQITQSGDGRLWMTQWDNAVQTVPISGDAAAQNYAEIDIVAYKLHFDREGSMWMIGTFAEGIKRLRAPENLKGKIGRDSKEIERFSSKDGLPENTTGNILEDYEGNIWISSNKGLSRFSRGHLVPVLLPHGYARNTLLPGDNGEIWVSAVNKNPILRIKGEEFILSGPPMSVSSVYRDPDGTTWWGSNGGIWKQNKERFVFFPHPLGSKVAFWEIFPADHSGGIWARLGDLGVIHLKDGTWSEGEKPEGLPVKGPSASFKDPQGRVWLGYSSGNVCFIQDGRVQSFSRDDGLDIGKIRVIRGGRNRGGEIWIGGETGLAVFHNGRFRTVSAAGDAFAAVSGIVETADGSLWLSEFHGIVHIASADIRRWIEDQSHPVNYRVYDIHDGMPGGPQMNYTVSSAVEATDGRIWFATDNGLTWIDPSRIEKNKLPPPVVVKSLTIDEKTFQSTDVPELPEGTENLRIKYTALSLSVPQRVQFKYKLEGIDQDWRDAGTRREASFTNLGPGEYTFRVIASNNDGVWNEEGAALKFTILPMFYQTKWFFALCGVAVILLAWLGYRWRVKQVKNLLQLQFQERLAERTRIAQDLHDKLLQGFVGAKMQLYAAVQDLPSEVQKTRRLKGIYEQLGELIEEGRDTIRDLRESDQCEFIDFEREFLDIRREFDSANRVGFRMAIAGTQQPLHYLIGTELLRIGHEALVNAFLHSQATVVEIEIEYGLRSMNLLVRDNGRGIDAEVLRAGREGHWGLTGMRERAEKIKADLKIMSRAGAGTEVVVSVPRQFAYKNTGRFSNWLRKFFGAKS